MCHINCRGCLLDSLVVECWLRAQEVPGSIPSQGPRHTKDVIKMVPVVPLFSTQYWKGKILALSQELRLENNVMDKIWDRKSFEVGGHWLLWQGWKNWMTTQNRQKSNAKKPLKNLYLISLDSHVYSVSKRSPHHLYEHFFILCLLSFECCFLCFQVWSKGEFLSVQFWLIRTSI